MLKRKEATDLLKEISRTCGDGILIDSVSLMPASSQSQCPPSPKTEPHFELHLQTTQDLYGDECLNGILKKRGLKLKKTKEFFIILRPDEQNNP